MKNEAITTAALGGLEIVNNETSASWTNIGMMRLRYPVGHPIRDIYEKDKASKARGEDVYVAPFEPTFTVKALTKTGLPHVTDVVGRFLAGLSGKSGSFYTEYGAIYSYGPHWRMVYRDGDAITYDDTMFKKPYSQMTSQHMQTVKGDPRLFGKVVNEQVVPQSIKDAVVARMVSSAIGLKNMSGFRSSVYDHIGYGAASDVVLRECFQRAKVEMGKQFSVKSDAFWRKTYTKESLAAVIAFNAESKPFYVNLISEYEKRWFKSYDEKMSPIPTRKAPFAPQLVRKVDVPSNPVTEKKAILAWHFHNGRLRFGDNREVVVGETLSVTGDPLMCQHGLHGSRALRDANRYFSGQFVSRVAIHGIIKEMVDKLDGTHRTCLGTVAVSDLIEKINATETGTNVGNIAQAFNNSVNVEAVALRMMGLNATSRTAAKKEGTA